MPCGLSWCILHCVKVKSFPVQDWGLAMAIMTYGGYSSFISVSFLRCCAGLTGHSQNLCATSGAFQ